LTINIPNILTVIRILLTPLFIIFLQKGLFSFALLVFTVAGISDGLDGLIARWFNQRSALGAYLDPIADKLLLVSSFVTLAILKLIPGWLTIVVLSRDILIVIGILSFAIMEVKIEIKPSFISKFTTVAQLATVFLVLVNPVASEAVRIKNFSYWVTAGLTIFSGLHYTYLGLNILQGASLNNRSKH
jgi:cardiolipin synthase